MAKSSSDATAIGSEAKESLSGRLSLIEDLYFPRKVQPDDAADPSRRKSLLLDLLSTDAPVFLGVFFSPLHLACFYSFISSLLTLILPRITGKGLERYGSKLSMEELNHFGREHGEPGERWSETLMRRSEEAILVEKIRGEQQRLGVAQSDWNHNAEMRAAVMDSLSVEEMQDRMEQFMYVMQQKFLSGEDHQHLDYSKIDEDVTLDDHWMKEANQDAEEKYFDDV
ncbi:hypothetical protein SASPL_155821 [Salvia splendens]|uniref:CCD97-like C-terminal domain-containing protein n=1 Tax=Salvia splendens TaxID=180675 RepID=A0A8X8YY04_SALSN|nr:hypothetical protein SASPL_155821 [Salvia splendens]